MPTIRTVCLVADTSSTTTTGTSKSDNNCSQLLLVNTAEPPVVVDMPPSSSTESSSPKETDKTVQRKSEITPTPPSLKQQQQQQPRGGGGQLTLASFFTKTNIPTKRKTNVANDHGKSTHNKKDLIEKSHANELIVVGTTTTSTINSEAKKSPKKRKLLRESKVCPEPTPLNCEGIVIEPVLVPPPPSELKNPTTTSVTPATTSAISSTPSVAIDLVSSTSTPHDENVAGRSGSLPLLVDDERYVRLVTRYSERQLELIQRANEDVEANETFFVSSSLEDIQGLPDAPEDMGQDNRLFPNALVGPLAAIVQGSRLPLAELSEYAHGQLCPLLAANPSHMTLTSLSVAEKIQLIAERKPYFGIPSKAGIDKWQDTTDRFVWRWELTTCDVLLPPEFAAQTKKARACRRRLASYYKAIVKLLDLIKSNTSTKNDQDIATAEERVLKFEREDEAKRLFEKKELMKKEAAEKQRLALSLRKEEEAAKKEAEKHLKQQERSRLKTLKDEEKRLKEEEKMKIRLEKERLELEQVSLAEEAKQKQRKLMANFFVSGEKLAKHADTAPTHACSDTIRNIPQNSNGHNVDAFWTLLGSSTAAPSITFPDQSNLHIRRTRHIKVSVTVTVAPLAVVGGFHNEDQCYSERRIISVPNKLKFLKFFEDYRPPYRGTWSKPRSRNVSGRRPFGKEETYLNYDVDSEAEWEEDVEDGEDLNSIAKDDDEDDEELGVDSRNYNYADGWLAQDDAKQEQPNEDVTSTWCLIAPLWNGIPIMFDDAVLPTNDECVVGISWSEARDVLLEHKSIVMPSNGDLDICMDAYKPVPETLLNENAAVTKREINGEELATFCQFIHGCTLSSKEKVVEDFRKNYPNILCSRAELFRKLDSITTKHRIPKGGIIWEVIQATIDELGLNDALKLDLPKPSPEISGDASDPTSVRNKVETNITPGEPTDSAKSNKSKRKSVTSHGETSVQENESGNHDSQTMSHSNKQAAKKKKRITPESIVTHASVALFASFLSKSKAQGAPPEETKTQNEAEHLLVAEK